MPTGKVTTRKQGEGKSMDAEKKMDWARKEFALDSPFFATELFILEVVEASKEEFASMPVPTMGTDGERLIYCREFVDKLDFNEILGIFAHELMHNISFHNLRRGQRDMILWNIACDLAINPIVRQAGFILPAGLLEDHRFEGMDAETIYNHLVKMDKNSMKQMVDKFMKGDGRGGAGTGACGWVLDKKNGDGSEMTPSQKKAAEKEQKVINEGCALNHQKMCGKLPAFLERIFGKLRESKVNWKEALAQFVEVNSKSDFDWKKPNRRYTKDNLYLPSAYKPEIGNVANLLDASGSISDKELREEVSELQGILWAYTGVTLHVSFFDTAASDFVEVTDDTEIKKLKINAGGGTDYVCAFKKLEQANLEPVCIIVLTDGYCDSFPKPAPDVPTLWILTGNHAPNFKPPFGDVIEMQIGSSDEE